MLLKLNLEQNAFHTLYRAILDFRSAKRPQESGDFDSDDFSVGHTAKDGHKYYYVGIGDGYVRPPHYYDFKFCILNLIQSIELLLKELLRRADPNSIFTDAAHTKTITFSEAVKRVLRVHPPLFDENQIRILRQAKDLRNNLEHFEVNWPAAEFESVARRLFTVIAAVCYSAFNILLTDYYSFDVWKEEGSDIVDTIREIVQREETTLVPPKLISDWLTKNPGDQMYLCLSCGHESYSIAKKKCVLCGEDFDEDIISLL